MLMKVVLDFLKDLTSHNTREWMEENRSRYKEAKSEFEFLVDELIKRISTFDPEIVNLKPKDCIFRINRDIRFSKDKSPYKTNFGAAIAPGGKKAQAAMYYCHIQPGNCFLAGGVYMPPADLLSKIRQEIDYNPEELKKIVEQPDFYNTWGEITGDELKTAPKGYPKDHPNIELIRKKSFVVMKSVSDKELTSDGFPAMAAESYKLLYPLNQYFSVAIS
jgi:uncharacterized protein (TIGR02453 family)